MPDSSTATLLSALSPLVLALIGAGLVLLGLGPALADAMTAGEFLRLGLAVTLYGALFLLALDLLAWGPP